MANTDDRDETPARASWAQRRAQMDADHAGHGRYRPCAGDDGLCPHDALPGLDRCAHYLGGQRPTCANDCDRSVVAPGLRRMVCSKPAAATEMGACPGYGGRTCGRAVQTEGLCARCKIEAEKARAATEAEYITTMAAATAAEYIPAPAPFPTCGRRPPPTRSNRPGAGRACRSVMASEGGPAHHRGGVVRPAGEARSPFSQVDAQLCDREGLFTGPGARAAGL